MVAERELSIMAESARELSAGLEHQLQPLCRLAREPAWERYGGRSVCAIPHATA